MAATGAMAVRDRGLRRSYGGGANEAVTVTRELRWWGCEISALAGSRARGAGVEQDAGARRSKPPLLSDGREVLLRLFNWASVFKGC